MGDKTRLEVRAEALMKARTEEAEEAVLVSRRAKKSKEGLVSLKDAIEKAEKDGSFTGPRTKASVRSSVEAEAKSGPSVPSAPKRSHRATFGRGVATPVEPSMIGEAPSLSSFAADMLKDPGVSAKAVAMADPLQAGRKVFLRTADQDYVGLVLGVESGVVVLASASLVGCSGCTSAVLAEVLKGGLVGSTVAHVLPGDGTCVVRCGAVRVAFAWNHPLPKVAG